MRIQRYLPSRAAEQVGWLTNFQQKLPRYAEVLEVPPATLADALADAGWAAYLLGLWQPAATTFAKAATSGVRLCLHSAGEASLPVFTPPPPPEGVAQRPNGAFKRLFRLILQLKLRRGMTDAIARDLGLLTLPTGAAPDAPRFLTRVELGPEGQPVVRITFWKHGHHGVTIETQRGDGTTVTFTPIVTSPTRDTRPLLTPGQPELRRYRMRYWHKGDPTGEWSPWQQVTLGPG